MLEKEDEDEASGLEFLEAIKEYLPSVKDPPKKKKKGGEWPAADSGIIVVLDRARTLMPPVGCLRFDPRSCSRCFSLNKFEPRDALLQCLQFAWTSHHLATGQICTVENLF